MTNRLSGGGWEWWRELHSTLKPAACLTRCAPRHSPHPPGGLSKLEQAATEVDALQKELTQARVVVQAATEECNQLLTVRPWPPPTVLGR